MCLFLIISDRAARTDDFSLVRDLLVGSLYYAEQLNMLTGWAHHIGYLILVDFTVSRGWSHIFALAGLMELPTFHLAISILHPKLRHNILFAATFFTTRIAFHVVLFISYFSKATRTKAVGGSFVPAGLFAAIFPLHVQWFTGCIKGFIRRSKARREPALLAQSTSDEPKLVQVIVQLENPGLASLAPELPLKGTTSTFDSSDTGREKSKPYPPSTQTLPSTPMPHSPPRIITMSPSTRARSRSSSAASVMSRPSSLVVVYSPTQANLFSRRRSLVSAEREESIRRLVGRVAGLADEAIAASPAVQSAVAVGRGMARTYNTYRGRAIDGVRPRGISWRRFNTGAVEAY